MTPQRPPYPLPVSRLEDDAFIPEDEDLWDEEEDEDEEGPPPRRLFWNR